ncbi:MAG: BREX-3 system P-loop-containing protein BrxF [Thermoanaerobacteraceae bacterium]|nr:BREX-3 system P-loop-containing protein BrxF [Thermoanaerobacteraceae bacterium]
MDIEEEIMELLDDRDNSYYRLIIIVGAGGSGKTDILKSIADQCGTYVNLGLALSEKLLEYPIEERAYKATDCLREILNSIEKEPLLIDNIELLFAPHLKLNPLSLLKHESRYRKIVAAWPGRFENDKLIYAEYGHPEYRTYGKNGIEVPILDLERRQIQ